MALLPSLRFRYRLLGHSFSLRPMRPAMAALPLVSASFSYPTVPNSLSLLFFSTLSSKTPVKPYAVPKGNKESVLVLGKDERFVDSGAAERVDNTSCTIAAIVTSMGGPPAAVGIVRLSGSSAVAIAGRVFRPARTKKGKILNGGSSSWQPTSHVVEYGVVADPHGNVVDEVLAIPMLAPRSYTREDVVELQCHGSEVCLNRVLRACLEAGARLAEPGQSSITISSL